MRELTYQTWIKQSVLRGGGYCLKLSHQYSTGIPDLLVSFPGFAACLIEVKWLGLVKPGYSRKIATTPKQVLELSRFDATNPGTGLVLVGCQMKTGSSKGYHHSLYSFDQTRAVDGHINSLLTQHQTESVQLAKLMSRLRTPITRRPNYD